MVKASNSKCICKMCQGWLELLEATPSWSGSSVRKGITGISVIQYCSVCDLTVQRRFTIVEYQEYIELLEVLDLPRLLPY